MTKRQIQDIQADLEATERERDELRAMLQHTVSALEQVLHEVPTSSTAFVKWAKKRVQDGKRVLERRAA